MDSTLVARRLKFHGVLLFLLGLLTGLLIPSLSNPRMGLSAHLEGLLNGTFLVLLGLIWRELRLAPRAASAAFWLVLFAAYANWTATLLSAAWGTGKLTPLAAGGRIGAPWQEAIVGVGLISLTLAILTGVAIVLFGLRGAGPER
jgi:hydroxylaminobenzene mutase